MEAQQVLDVISPIPEEEFITDTLVNVATKQCCTIGHLFRLTSEDPKDYNNALGWSRGKNAEVVRQFITSTTQFLSCVHGIDRASAFSFSDVATENPSIVSVNNNIGVNGYTEPGIKDRVVHFLRDMIEAGY